MSVIHAWTLSPWWPLIALVMGLAAIALAYLVRDTAHHLLLGGGRLLESQLRLLARSSHQTGLQIRERNDRLYADLEAQFRRRSLERSMRALQLVVDREQCLIDELDRRARDQLETLGEDYRETTAIPIPAPDWVAAVQAVAGLQDQQNPDALRQILADLQKTAESQQRDALREYRYTINSRHRILATLRPQWRRVSRCLRRLEHAVNDLNRRLSAVQRLAAGYSAVINGELALRGGSLLARFLIASVVVALGAGAAVVLLGWLEPALARQLPAPGHSGLLALLLTAAPVLAGVALFDTLQTTQLLPPLAGRRQRGLMIATVAFTLLLMGLSAWLVAHLPLVDGAAPATVYVNALLAVVLVGILTLQALPLEVLLLTLRPVVGILAEQLAELLAMVCRIAGSLVHQGAKLLVLCYDLLICLPLAVERAWRARQATVVSPSPEPPEVGGESVVSVRFPRGVRRGLNR
ncbi:MAG TPA: hypothetical protein VL027_09110 [Spongiibacteraceae bacterium]|nr:hypothetical protein [Spongiibacteraceae bacterium]